MPIFTDTVDDPQRGESQRNKEFETRLAEVERSQCVLTTDQPIKSDERCDPRQGLERI